MPGRTLRFSLLTTVSLTMVACGASIAAEDTSGGTAKGGTGAIIPGAGVSVGGIGTEVTPVPPGTDFEACTGVAEEAENTLAPADVVFLVDNSPSMRDEILWTRQNMNEFSRTIEAHGIDARIVMISCLRDGCDGHSNTLGICIAPPLGNGDCATSDTNLSDYLHVDLRQPSEKLLQRAISSYDTWKPSLRPFALTHFVAISDDADLTTSAAFTAQLAALNPPITRFVFHGIVSSMSKEDACALSTSNPCCTYAAPGGEGVSYNELAAATGGVAADLCAQDFAPVFAQFAQSVIAHSELNCEWTIPQPPAGQALDPNLINVEFSSAGNSTYFGYVTGPNNCGTLDNAWYYDDPTAPNRVLVCPSTCSRIRSAPAPSITVSFGCKTVEVSTLL
jgi:hypothetical protein